MNSLEKIKLVLREDDTPFFTDDQLNFYLEKNQGNVNDTIYECLLIKAEDTTISVSGFTSSDTSKYFRRMASRYRPHNSGILS